MHCSRSSGTLIHKGTHLLTHYAIRHEVLYIIFPLSHPVFVVIRCFLVLFASTQKNFLKSRHQALILNVKDIEVLFTTAFNWTKG